MPLDVSMVLGTENQTRAGSLHLPAFAFCPYQRWCSGCAGDSGALGHGRHEFHADLTFRSLVQKLANGARQIIQGTQQAIVKLLGAMRALFIPAECVKQLNRLHFADDAASAALNPHGREIG